MDGDVVEERSDGTRVVRITKLRAAILASGFPAYYVGAQAGIHHSTVSLYATGQRPIKVAHLATLSRVLGTDPDDLVGWSYFKINLDQSIEPCEAPDVIQ